MKRELIGLAMLSIAVGGFGFSEGSTDAIQPEIKWDSIESEVVESIPEAVIQVGLRKECKDGVCGLAANSIDYTPTEFVTDSKSSKTGLFGRLRSLRGNRGSRRCRCN